MSAERCEKCDVLTKTYWVSDKEWLCRACFKKVKSTPKPESISKFACGLQLEDDDEN